MRLLLGQLSAAALLVLGVLSSATAVVCGANL